MVNEQKAGKAVDLKGGLIRTLEMILIPFHAAYLARKEGLGVKAVGLFAVAELGVIGMGVLVGSEEGVLTGVVAFLLGQELVNFGGRVATAK